MANLTKKVLGLAGTAMVFAGMSFGQNFNACSIPVTNVPPILDRWEGTTELVSDIIINCPAGTTLSGAAVKLQMSLPITSPVINPASGATDAVIQINDATSGNVIYPGVAIPGSPTQMVFTGVNFPADAFTMTFSNIRVNASMAANGTSNIPVTETFFVLNLGTEIYNLVPAASVGYVQSGFTTPILSLGGPNPAQYVICTGNPANAATQSFQITQSTLFGGALKTQTPGQGYGPPNPAPIPNLTNGEAGSYTGTAGYGVATHGTRIQLAFSSVATGETIYLPNTLQASTGGNPDANVFLVLTQSATGPFKAFPAASIGAKGTPAGTVGFAPGATGTVTAVYEAVRADNTIQTETLTIPGFITAAANFSPTSVPAVVLNMGLAPQAGAGVTDIPAFTTNYPAINLSAFNLCQTTLLFPFVAAGPSQTATPGFDTGIAISNTGMDPYLPGTGAVGSPGTCSFNLYSTLSGSTPPTPAAIATSLAALQGQGYPANGIIPPGATVAFSLSTENIAPNFTGYIIAQCQFLYAHGFAYITFGGNAPVAVNEEMAMGYLAEVLPNNRSKPGPNNNAINNGAGPESTTF